MNEIDPEGTDGKKRKPGWWYFTDSINQEFNPFYQQPISPVAGTSRDLTLSSLTTVQAQREEQTQEALEQAVKAWRLAQAAKGSSLAFKGNVAAFKLDDGTIRIFQSINNRVTRLHAERVGLNQLLDAEHIAPNRIVAVYSELEPCTIPAYQAGCKALLIKRIPNARVYHSYEYGDSAESRAAGVEELTKAMQVLKTLSKLAE